MIRFGVSQVGRFIATILLVAALIIPQTIDYEKSLFWCLPSYAGIAIALLIAAATIGLDCRRDIFCLVAALAFVGYVVVRALTSAAPYSARSDLYLSLGALTLYGLIATGLRGSSNRIVLILLLLIFAVFHVFFGLVQFGFGQNFMFTSSLSRIMVDRRASGLYVDPGSSRRFARSSRNPRLERDLLESMAGLGQSDRGLSHS